MIICLQVPEKLYRDLSEDVKDFNFTAYDMNCEPISIPDYCLWLIRQEVAEWKKRQKTK